MPVEQLAPSLETSIVTTAIQAVAAGMFTLLGRVLLQTVRPHFLACWIAGWAAMTAALLSLIIAFVATPLAYSAYCSLEYVAALLWLAGGRHLATGRWISRIDAYWLLPAIVAGLILPFAFLGKHAADAYIGAHLGIMSGFFLLAGIQLIWHWQVVSSPGVTVMVIAYFALAASFLHTAIFSMRCYFLGDQFAYPHLQYSALYDLLAQSAVAFGMVMVVMEKIQRELVTANSALQRSGRRLRELAHVDPLTGALNRHAFDELMRNPENSPASTGLVVVLDLDKLKVINDTLGHPVGDRAIQLVAAAVRTLIRSDDLLFRWGGDEFVLLWFGVSQSDAEQRLTRLNSALTERVKSAGIRLPVELSASFGVARFESIAKLEEAIKLADAAMYALKSSKQAEANR